MSEPTNNSTDWSSSLAFLTLRAWLGVRSLVTGIEKFSGTRTVQQPLLDAAGNPDSSGAVVEVQQKFYSLSAYQAIPESMRDKFSQEPFMPAFLTTPFYAVLGWVLIVLGITVLLGVCTRVSLFAMGLLYVGLTVGLILIKQDAGIAWLAIHVVMIAYALTLEKHNRFAITRS
ncbi:MAG: DoxX family membrane protein [Opitutae bacterium]|nr:DoxX family membrane protein [Opitutae bacterium]